MATVFETTEELPMPSDPAEPIHALLIAEDDAAYRRLADSLREAGIAVVDGTAATTVDLVVISRQGPNASQHAHGRDTFDRPGVLRIGALNQADDDGSDADATLPSDFTARELALVCHLLAELTRLRRRLHEGDRQRHVWREQASCDPLTQLPNRRAWLDELSRRIKRARHSNEPLCVALVDLDFFKQVNDGWGHPAGDQLLAATAGALRQSLRTDDFVARLGGDEFGLLMSGLDIAAAGAVIERVRASLPARIAQSTPFVTSASIGYHVYDGQADITPEELLAAADRARRMAKTQGRARSASG